MTLIKLFLPDFKKLVRKNVFLPETDTHPTTYSDGEFIVSFYKPIGNFIYCVEVEKPEVIPMMEGQQEPKEDLIRTLIMEFNAIELAQPINHYRIEQQGRIFQ